jgi:hypothetical protein
VQDGQVVGVGEGLPTGLGRRQDLAVAAEYLGEHAQRVRLFFGLLLPFRRRRRVAVVACRGLVFFPCGCLAVPAGPGGEAVVAGQFGGGTRTRGGVGALGRHGEHVGAVVIGAEMLRRLRAGQLWFWVSETGERVHLTGVNPPSFGVARVGPVYTPPVQRGRGWASNAVAEVSRQIQAEGARACLFTDQANPISNKIYAALGFRPVADMANLVIAR